MLDKRRPVHFPRSLTMLVMVKAVKQRHIPNPNPNPNPNPRQTSKPQNTDPEFGENVRIMYKAITMLHHLNNTTIEPPTITRLVDYLSNIIKPAVPNPL